MQIREISPSFSEIVETDDSDWPTYRRHGPESWENLMGCSWEDVGYPEELEKAYQLKKSLDSTAL